MSRTALKTLRNALSRNLFEAAYYVCGADEFQKEDAVRQLLEATVDPATRDFNLDIRRGPDLDVRTLDSLVSAMPMMAERRVLVIRDAEALRKEARTFLERYLESPSPDVLLIIVGSAEGKFDKALGKLATVLEFEPLTADRIPRWIGHQSQTAFHTPITADAAELLHTGIGGDLHQLTAELDKLSAYTGGREIDEAAVSAVAGVRRGETMADLLDAIAGRDAEKALELLPHVLSQPKTSGVSIVMALTAQTLALGWGITRVNEGLSRSRLRGEYFGFLRECGSVYTGRSWDSAISAWIAAIDFWDGASLSAALDALLSADEGLKDVRFSSEEQMLRTLILVLCASSERKVAA